tara:strand:- start:575 stop:1399 length:825 start_codon:yes stop_codon:yes gene_type:complete
MKQYINLVQDILKNGVEKNDRTGTGTISTFGQQLKFDLQKGFPLLTTKKIHTKSIIHELLWFISGDTNIKYLQDNGVKIWDEWVREDNTIGKGYGHQWRRWTKVVVKYRGVEYIDQLQRAINDLRTNPDSRRIIVSAWNVGELEDMALPPCHMMFQFWSREEKGKRYLSCQLYMRSTDAFLGLPFNIASYALLTQMIAKITNHIPEELIYIGGDCHIYKNHIEQCKLQVSRMPKTMKPKMIINGDQKEIDDFKYEDFELINYEPHPHIKGEVSV